MGWKTRTPYAKRENGIVDIGANEFIKMAKILGYETNNLDIFTQDVPEKNDKQIKGGIQMQDLQIFNFEELPVRTLTVNEEPFFVGKDVAEILGYSNTRDALYRHVDGEDKDVVKLDTLGGTQK